jgi:hypothetical protein
MPVRYGTAPPAPAPAAPEPGPRAGRPARPGAASHMTDFDLQIRRVARACTGQASKAEPGANAGPAVQCGGGALIQYGVIRQRLGSGGDSG